LKFLGDYCCFSLKKKTSFGDAHQKITLRRSVLSADFSRVGCSLKGDKWQGYCAMA
jgi:hypothetical protein